MAFGKKKLNKASRYAHMESPWIDDPGNGSDDRRDAARDESYGLRDSYSRQASYGRPEGYYDEVLQDRSRTRRMPDRSDIPSFSDAKAAGSRDDVSYFRQVNRTNRAGEIPGYTAPVWAPDQAESAGKTASEKPHSVSAAAEYDAGKKKSGKSAFWIKLLLLLIAAGVLAVVWRFSRMQHVGLKDTAFNAGILPHEGYEDFVIYGVDSREGSLTKDAHSDTIILCSMNQASKQIRLVSVYRDTYLDNTNGEFRKATECYFFGGPSRSVNMLNRNLDLALKNYLSVDFSAVVKAVDLIGGVSVEVTEEELPYINGYQEENAQVTGAGITPVTSAGYQRLNGIQALAYCRIRYTAGDDYRRTERQRTVLTQIFEQARIQGAVKMAQIIDAMLPHIATSFSNTELMNLAKSISEYSLGETCGFPFDQIPMNIAAGDCVVPVNLAQNVSKLHAFLYGTQNYIPSETVQQISNEIAMETGTGY